MSTDYTYTNMSDLLWDEDHEMYQLLLEEDEYFRHLEELFFNDDWWEMPAPLIDDIRLWYMWDYFFPSNIQDAFRTYFQERDHLLVYNQGFYDMLEFLLNLNEEASSSSQ